MPEIPRTNIEIGLSGQREMFGVRDPRTDSPERKKLMAEAEEWYEKSTTGIREYDFNNLTGEKSLANPDNEHSIADQKLRQILDKIIELDKKEHPVESKVANFFSPIMRFFHAIRIAFLDFKHAISNWFGKTFEKGPAAAYGTEVLGLEREYKYAGLMRELYVRELFSDGHRSPSIEMTEIKRGNNPVDESPKGSPAQNQTSMSDLVSEQTQLEVTPTPETAVGEQAKLTVAPVLEASTPNPSNQPTPFAPEPPSPIPTKTNETTNKPSSIQLPGWLANSGHNSPQGKMPGVQQGWQQSKQQQTNPQQGETPSSHPPQTGSAHR